MTLCDVPSGAPSGSWGSQHSILFAGLGDPFVSLVAEGGGAPRVVLKADASRQREGRLLAEIPSRWPPLPLPGEERDRETARAPSGEHRGRQDGPAPDELFARAVRAGRPERPRQQPIRVSALRARREPAGTAIRQPADAACGRRRPGRAGDRATRAHWVRLPSRRRTTVFSPLGAGQAPRGWPGSTGPAGRRVPSRRQPDSNRCDSLPTPEGSSSTVPTRVRA